MWVVSIVTLSRGSFKSGRSSALIGVSEVVAICKIKYMQSLCSNKKGFFFKLSHEIVISVICTVFYCWLTGSRIALVIKMTIIENGY